MSSEISKLFFGHPYGRLTLAAAFLGLAAAIGWIETSKTIELSASRDWPSVAGRIVEQPHVRVDDSSSSSAAHIDLRYAYRVGGRDYAGDRIWVEGSTAPRATALAAMQTFAREEVQVYFNPGNPKRSVLIPGVTVNLRPWHPLYIFYCCIFFVIGSSLSAVALRQLSRRRTSSSTRSMR